MQWGSVGIALDLPSKNRSKSRHNIYVAVRFLRDRQILTYGVSIVEELKLVMLYP